MLAQKPTTLTEFEFDVNIRYIQGIAEQEVRVPQYSTYMIGKMNMMDDYNCHASALEDILQNIHDESYHYGVHPIAVIHQLRKNKKCNVETDWEHSGYYRLIASRRDISKFLNVEYDDIIKACATTQIKLAQMNTFKKPILNINKDVPHHIPTRKEIERAIQLTVMPNSVCPSVYPALAIVFQETHLALLLDNYLKDKDFQELTNLFEKIILNDDQVSISYDRNRRFLTTFDESAMLFMLMFPSMIYIPQYGKVGLAKCHFNELNPTDEVDMSKGIVEYSTLNHRQIIVYEKPQLVDTSIKFTPSIQFFESMLLGGNTELKIYPYDHGTGLERKHMLFNGVPTKQLFKQITRFLSNIPINK